MRKNKFYILHFTFYILLILTINNCSSTTGVSKGNLTGIVNLEGMDDHSGIIIAVYELAYLDTTIVRINNEYPHIGIIINQHTEFDHRFQSPVKYTETDIEGNFLIEKIPVGEYNIVALKDSFGFKYIYEFDIEKGENQLTPQSSLRYAPTGQPPLFKPIEGEHKVIPLQKGEQKGVYSPPRTDADITLYAEHHLSGDITEDWIFETDHHYIIGEEGANSTNFMTWTNLVIQPVAIIRIEPENDLIIHGTISAQGVENNMFWITSNSGFALNDSSSNFQFSILNFKFDRSEELLQYNSMELSSIASVSDDLIEWGKFDFANTCLLNQVNNLHMQNGIFRNSQCGFYSTTTDSTFCSNLLCMNITNESDAGIYFCQVSDGFVEKNIITDCEKGIQINDTSYPDIRNNYIENCHTSLKISWYSSPEVYNNEIHKCIIGFYIYHYSFPTIYNNNIKANYGLRTIFCTKLSIEVHFNNFNCLLYNLETLPYGFNPQSPSPTDVNGENNYYYTTDESEIQNKIFDKNDVEPLQQQYYGIVDYVPFLTQEYYNAGIKGD